jgi:hypothetical protein
MEAIVQKHWLDPREASNPRDDSASGGDAGLDRGQDAQ